MSEHPLDAQEIIFRLFHVRKTPPDTHPDRRKVRDGAIKIADEVQLGYRLYLHKTDAPVILYFHGNGEIASDYDDIAPFYELAGVSLLVVDYRGYGWSTGLPKTTQMLPDAEKVLTAVPGILADHGFPPDTALFVKGRSLGSAPAIYLAYAHADKLRGLIVESGYADAPSLFQRLGMIIPASLKDEPTLPLFNARKMASITLPLLVIHGENDTLIPVSNGKAIYESAASTDKILLTIPNAGHNDLLMTGTAKYFDAIRRFVAQHSS